MRHVLRLLLVTAWLLLISFTFGHYSSVGVAPANEVNTNSVAFWCGSEDAGVKFDNLTSLTFTVPPLPAGISSWSLLVLKAGSDVSVETGANETFVNPGVGLVYAHSSGKTLSHAILCFGPPVTTTTHATTTTGCPECTINTVVITPPPTTTIATTTTQASTTTANSTSTSSSSTTSTSTSTSSTSSSTTTPTTTPRGGDCQINCGTTTAPTTTGGGGGAGGGGTTLATTAAPTTTTTTVNRGAAPTDEFVPPATVAPPTTVLTTLPVTGASGDLYWIAVGATIATCIGLVLVARMAPRRR